MENVWKPLQFGLPQRTNGTEVESLLASFLHPKGFQVHEVFIMFQVRQLGYGQQLLLLHREDPMVVQVAAMPTRQLLDVVMFAEQLVELGRHGHQTCSRHFGQLSHQDLPMAQTAQTVPFLLAKFGMVGDGWGCQREEGMIGQALFILVCIKKPL